MEGELYPKYWILVYTMLLVLTPPLLSFQSLSYTDFAKFVGCCRIHQLILCRGVRFPNEGPGYDTKKSDGEVSVMLELWE